MSGMINMQHDYAQSLAESVDHPAHYGGEDDPYEAIKVTEAWGLNFHLGNALKYLKRGPYKGGLEDLKKARWYLGRYIEMKEAERDQRNL